MLECQGFTVRTDSVVVDALLGHGVALDTYALATQQESLRKLQAENRKAELALEILEKADVKKAKLFSDLFQENTQLFGLRLDHQDRDVESPRA